MARLAEAAAPARYVPRNRTLELAWVLAKADLTQRYFGSVLGALWTMIRPLMLFGVLYVVFNHIVRVGGAIRNYPLYLLMALSIWGSFAELSTGCLNCLVARASILQKIRIPIVSIPLSLVITTGIQALANLAVLVVFLIGSGVDVQLGWLALPFAIALVMIFAWGAGLILSIAFVWFRDVGPIWEVISQLMFWATPVIYVATYPSRPLRDILGLNPLSPILTELRRLVIDPTAPSAVDVFSSWALIGSGGILVATIAGGLLLFRARAHSAIEHL